MRSPRLHPKSSVPYVILGVGLAASSFVGLARVMGGNHFITDVAAGAVIGTSMGVLIPSVHTTPVKAVPIVSETQKGVGESRHDHVLDEQTGMTSGALGANPVANVPRADPVAPLPARSASRARPPRRP